jgi:hypothetical protein
MEREYDKMGEESSFSEITKQELLKIDCIVPALIHGTMKTLGGVEV